MNPHRHDIEQLYAHLHSSAQGLSQAEATQRLKKYGANELEEISGQSLSGKLIKEFTHFFALILWLAAGLAFFAEYREPGQGMDTLGYAVLGVIIVNGLFSFWQEYRAEKALTALRDLLPRHTTVLRNGMAVQLPVAELVPGDVVLLNAGDDVPADCRLIEAFGVRVNTATLTGESKPMSRETGAPASEQAALTRDVLHAGTSLISGEAKAMVYATGMHTEFGNIARLTQVAREPLSPLQKEIARLSRLVALFAVLLGAAFFVIGQMVGLSFWANLVFAIGIIVANVPEGLLPTVTLSLAMATQRMAKKNALVRHLPAVETLGAASVICSDKTGTLTQNRMSIRQVYFSGELLEVGQGESSNSSGKSQAPIPFVQSRTSNLFVPSQTPNPFVLSLSKERTALHSVDIHPSTGSGRTDELCSGRTDVLGSGRTDELCSGRTDELGSSRTDDSNPAQPLYAIMRHCHDLRRVDHNGKAVWQGDPMEIALLQGVPPGGAEYRRVDEIPFDTERKRMSVICDTPQGRMLYCKGAPETVLPLCSEMLQQGEVRPLDEAGRAGLFAAHEQMTEQGLRVIALAYRHEAKQESELIFAGLIGLIDPPRPGVAEAIATCHSAGIRVIMVTGDHPHTAGALAREIGLAQNPVAITGDKLRTLSDTDLRLLLDEPELIFARTGADQKMRIVQALQLKGEIVAVTGDGVNDAPALKCADVGIAMGISGTDVAKEAADIVLLDDHFATIVAAIEEGRAVYDNVRKFLTYILTSNIPEMVPYLAFVLFKIPLPLTII